MERSKTRWQQYVETHPEVAQIHGIERVALRQRVRHGIGSSVGWVDEDATEAALMRSGPLYPLGGAA